MVDFALLSKNWMTWSARAGMQDPVVSLDCDDCDAAFVTADESYHVRQDGDWWIVDRVNDRGKRYNNTAQLSTFQLLEKYLIWTWASSARQELASGRLGADLYALGYSPDVTVQQAREGFAEINSESGSAVLSVVKATIFSHLMLLPLDELEQLIDGG
ncbi:hypothetical protein [Mycolicibacterium fluoranthenivorans]|uniref:Uncharacterized protein n=1 Tax=Mycolicibacterium fluoranthenivorans TaxID=258505 RepID=A0A7X5TVM4_9MYCO|nr:hypothetical protein [Mycolicibacterium fluoranthenivorans]NIH93589.1 hypothetical protein [Mycolicibacterium fluoranthenivorans]